MKKMNSESNFDTKESTFISKIFCTSGVILTGYSKRKGLYGEGNDKTVLIEKWLKRLRNNDYLNPLKVIRIEFYLNKNGYEENRILTVYTTGLFSTGIDYKEIDFPQLKRHWYALFKNPEVDIQSHKPKRVNEDQIFDLKAKRFSLHNELLFFCMEQYKNGFEKYRIATFYNSYIEKYPFKYQ